MQAPKHKDFKFPRVMLAPLSGISSLPFRTLNREFGCKFAYLEMISARSLSYSSKRTMQMLLSNTSDKPLGVQLLGENMKYILKSLEKIKDYDYQILDFNAACPRKKVTSHGKGAALLLDAKKLKALLSGIIKEVTVPVTVKMRIGYSDDRLAEDLAKHIEDAGVSGICVHGRTRDQGYRGVVDYSAIKKIKKSVSVPIIGSGDIWNPELAKKMFDETNCDAVLVARGALGNPWIFRGIDEFLSTGKILPLPNIEEIVQVMKHHLGMCIDFYGERVGVMKFRKFYIWYTKGFTRVKPLRHAVAYVHTNLEMIELIDKFSKEA
jgi:tRNA-dihydrouridine synthase B